jgi:hypothetical protein
MAKEKEEVIVKIKPSEYVEELEHKVKLEVARITALGLPEKRTTKYKYTEFPEFGNNIKARTEWEMEEIRRCMNGYDGIPGRYYYYLNHTFIKHKKRGKIRPDFRTMDLEWFKFLERVENERPIKGIVCIKRRQVGMSWKAAVDMVWSATFNTYYEIGMNSKTETDSRNLFAKVKFIYRHQSPFLRAATSTDRRDAMEFIIYDKDQFGNKVPVGGTGSTIISTAPVETGHAGNSYRKLIMDEAGETEALEGIWSNAEDCIVQDGERTGIPIFFGTMGLVEKSGKGLMEFWKNADMYDLERFPFYGYHELIMDEFGNDDIEESVRFVLYKRKKLEGGSPKVYKKYIQKYPLTEQDAFLSVGGGGVGNPLTIAQQEINLYDRSYEVRVGRMKQIGETPQFEPNPNGNFVIYELPQEGLIHAYRAVLDPAEDDNVKKSKDTSDLGFTIAAKPFGLLPLRLVAEYCHRPLKLEEAYQQFALACLIYNCKLTIEMNKGGWRAFKWFEQYYPQLLEYAPKSATSARGGVELKYGVKMTPDRKNQMEGLLNEYIDNHCLPDSVSGYKGIPSKKLLAQFKVHGSEHEDDDLSVSFGWQLILNQADKRAVQHASDALSNRPQTHFQRVGNLIQLVNTKGEPIRRLTLPKNPLFNR